LNDEQLVSTYRESGKAELLDQLMVRHLPKVRGLVFRMLLDDGSTDDVTQEVFLKAFRGLDSFQGQSKFGTWLYRVAINVVHDFLRKENRSRVEYRADLPQPESEAVKPEQAALQSELMGEVHQALAGLSPSLRAAMALTVLDQHSPKEAAEIEDCSLETMYWRIHEARKQLKQGLNHYVT
jgi:RNA polymerase sigma-70 factor (ECF subfamily)